MNNKIEQLKDLIEQSEMEPQVKLNNIIKTLQWTDDIMRAKVISDKIMNGDFNNLKENVVDNLIKSFSKKDNKEPLIIIDEDEEQSDNKTLNLEYKVRLMEESERNYKKQIQELKDKNKKLESFLSLTKNFELIELNDEDINEMYIRYLRNGELGYRDAFVIGNIIPKSYYKIK